MGQNIIKDGMLYPVLTKVLYDKHSRQGWGERRIRSKYGLSKAEFVRWKDKNLKKGEMKMATKTVDKKVNTFEREYHEAIKQIRDLEEKNKRLHLSADNLNKDLVQLKEKLAAEENKTELLGKTLENFSEENNELADRLSIAHSEKKKIKDFLENENLKLKNEFVEQDYHVKNQEHLITMLNEKNVNLEEENNALKVLVKLWS